MGRYLVTGGAGFIGGTIARRLAHLSHDVTILDLPQKLQGSPPPVGIEVIAADISEPDAYQGIQGSFDAVIHLAAQTSARVSHEEPRRDVDTNARGTMLLAQWCIQQNVARLLYGSSMAVYGNPTRLRVRETDTTLPLSFYGVSKLAGEHYLQAHIPLGLRPTIFRMFNVYGPGQDMDNLKQGMLSVYLAYINAGEPVSVTGSLDRFRDFIYIDDVAEAFIRTLEDEPAAGEIYNLGTGKTCTVREALDVLIKSCGHDPATYPVRRVEGHPGDIFGICADSTRFQNAYNWTPNISLADGVERMVAWLGQGVGR